MTLRQFRLSASRDFTPRTERERARERRHARTRIDSVATRDLVLSNASHSPVSRISRPAKTIDKSHLSLSPSFRSRSFIFLLLFLSLSLFLCLCLCFPAFSVDCQNFPQFFTFCLCFSFFLYFLVLCYSSSYFSLSRSLFLSLSSSLFRSLSFSFSHHPALVRGTNDYLEDFIPHRHGRVDPERSQH